MAQTVATPTPLVRRRPPGTLIVGVLFLLVFSPLIISIISQIIRNPALFLEQFKVGLVNGAIIAIIALGYTLVYGIIELINFAHGDVYMIGTMLALSLLTAGPGLVGISQPGLLPPVLLAAVLVLTIVACMAACGTLNVVIAPEAYPP